jgi:hypothetical protein
MNELHPDRGELSAFVNALFPYAGNEGFVSLRAFYDGNDSKPFRINGTSLAGGLGYLTEAAEDDAYRAANNPKAIVFCPPIAVFSNKDRAREQDLSAGLALSVECDQHPVEAAARLEEVLGPATVIVRSGGQWTDDKTGQVYDKLHLHWRLREPARGSELKKLKQARDIATRLVGGDPSNKPVCHPIRWPGSWHRKKDPKLCQIETLNQECEIDLDTAVASLTAAAPPRQDKTSANGKDDGTGHDQIPQAWQDLVKGVITGDDYHGALCSLAAKCLTSGMSAGAAVNMLRALMLNSAGPRDERWQVRFDDIPRAVETAAAKGFGPQVEPPKGPLIQHSSDFVRGFIPPDYVVVGLIQRRFIYSLTGQTGSGKTAVTLRLAASAAQGIEFAGRETKPVRVLYAAAENPDDVRMRWIALAPHMGFDVDKIEVYFTKDRFKISQMKSKLRAEAEKAGGEFGLVIIDTSPAFFEGDDENSRS